MKKWKELDEFFNRHNGDYINRHAVLFKRVTEGFYFVSARWPKYTGEEDVSLVYLCNDVEEFFENLQIEHAGQLDKVRPELLLQLFYSGAAMVLWGSANDSASLEFEIDDGKLLARPGNSDLTQEVEENLKTPEDFARYGIRYFALTKQKLIKRN